MDSLPVGSHGYVRGVWSDGGGGHVWSWRRTSDGLVWEDAQLGTVVSVAGRAAEIKPGTLKWFRVDDADYVGDPGAWVAWPKK
ncbi:MAG: hypothetical protein LBD70_01680 [Bifidobacteriaceae bacterium]|nr:hypothetical protein [Bifidobacteriaceae bacterium]